MVMTEFQRSEGENIEDMYASTLRTLEEGDIISGKVVRTDTDEVLVDIGYKSEGFSPQNSPINNFFPGRYCGGG